MFKLKILNITGEYFYIDIDRNQLELNELSNILDIKIYKTDRILYLLLNGEKIYTNIYKIKPYNKLITFILDSNNECELNIIYTSFFHNNENYYDKLFTINKLNTYYRYTNIHKIFRILNTDNSDLLDDENFITYASINNEIFQYASNRLRYDKNFILQLFKYNINIIKNIPQDLDLDLNLEKDYLLELSHDIEYIFIYKYIPSSYHVDKLFMFKIMNNFKYNTHYEYPIDIYNNIHYCIVFARLASKKQQSDDPHIFICKKFLLDNQETDDYNFMLKLITKYPNIYKIFTPELKNIYAYALCAIQQDALLFKKIPNIFHKDKQFILEAIKQNINVLPYACHFHNDYEIISFVENKNFNFAMKYASRKIKQKYYSNYFDFSSMSK